MKINGNGIAKKILAKLKDKLKKLQITPKLAIILVGDNPISQSYVLQKEKKAKELGIKTTIIKLSSSGITKNLLKEKVGKLNNDNHTNGIIIQRPLPSQITSDFATNIIVKEKDVDGLRKDSLFESPMGQAVKEILNSIGVLTLLKRKKINKFVSYKITIIGKGETGGRPVIDFFKKQGIEPVVIDSKTKNPQRLIKRADIVISTVGKSGVIKTKDLKKGVVLIGIGMHKNKEGKFEADYNQKEIEKVASFYTPVPGGVGPITVSMLLKNVVKAVEKE